LLWPQFGGIKNVMWGFGKYGKWEVKEVTKCSLIFLRQNIHFPYFKYVWQFQVIQGDCLVFFFSVVGQLIWNWGRGCFAFWSNIIWPTDIWLLKTCWPNDGVNQSLCRHNVCQPNVFWPNDTEPKLELVQSVIKTKTFDMQIFELVETIDI
jgi:hypothetical protein